jgi:hypothetical protein
MPSDRSPKYKAYQEFRKALQTAPKPVVGIQTDKLFEEKFLMITQLVRTLNVKV